MKECLTQEQIDAINLRLDHATQGRGDQGRSQALSSRR